MLKIIFLTTLSLALTSCSTGKCRQKKDEKTFVEHVENLPDFKSREAHSIKAGDLQTVRVYKSDGTLQCEANRPIPAADLKRLLEDNKIKVLRLEHTSDGVMHIQVCGSSTGRIYVFDIQAMDLEKALGLGFRNFKDLKP